MSVPPIPRPADTDVFLQRDFAASPELLWRLWLDPHLVQHWFGPREVHIDPRSVTVEERIGGQFDLDMVDNDSGQRFPIRSQLIALDPPRYLEGIADAETGTDEPVLDISLRVWFEPSPTGTTLTLLEGPFEPKLRDLTAAGWLTSFEKADALLA